MFGQRIGSARAKIDWQRRLRCSGYLSHYPDAEHDLAWLLNQLAERDARIAELKAQQRQDAWMPSLP